MKAESLEKFSKEQMNRHVYSENYFLGRRSIAQNIKNTTFTRGSYIP